MDRESLNFSGESLPLGRESLSSTRESLPLGRESLDFSKNIQAFLRLCRDTLNVFREPL